MEIRYGRTRKGIKRQLSDKMNEWLNSIEDENVRKIAYDNVIVTGGSIASMLLGEKINDYDVYFRTKDATIAVAEYYVKKFNKANRLDKTDGIGYIPYVKLGEVENIKGELEDRVLIYAKSAGVASESQTTYQYFELRPEEEQEEFVESLNAYDDNSIESAIDTYSTEKGKSDYRPVFLSMNAITLSNDIQIVIRFFGEPEKIHSNYDFVHACSYYTHKERNLVIPAEAMESLLSRHLVYRGSLYPIASIFRMKKFLERGWRITAGQQLKIMWQISEVDMTDFETLKEQLTGVDQAYLNELVDSLKNVDSNTIDSAYVSAIIDKIF